MFYLFPTFRHNLIETRGWAQETKLKELTWPQDRVKFKNTPYLIKKDLGVAKALLDQLLSLRAAFNTLPLQYKRT